jgi:hypothetical protein
MHITLTSCSSTTADDAAPNKTAKATTTTCSRVIHKTKVLILWLNLVPYKNVLYVEAGANQSRIKFQLNFREFFKDDQLFLALP